MRFLLLSIALLLAACAETPRSPLMPTLRRTMVNDLALFVWQRYPPTQQAALALSGHSPIHSELDTALRKLGYAVQVSETPSDFLLLVQLRTEPLGPARWLLTVHWGSAIFSRAYGPVRGGTAWSAISPWTQREVYHHAG